MRGKCKFGLHVKLICLILVIAVFQVVFNMIRPINNILCRENYLYSELSEVKHYEIGNLQRYIDTIRIDNKTLEYDIPDPRNLSTEAKIALGLLDAWERKYGTFKLRPDDNPYFIHTGNLTCLREGSDLVQSFEGDRPARCVCLAEWTGEHCSVPKSVTRMNPNISFPLRQKPRRIVATFPYNGEYEMLSYRLHVTGDLLHGILIQDAVHTGYRDAKNISHIPFLLHSDLPDDIKRRVVPQVMFSFPPQAAVDGWAYDSAIKNFPFRRGLPKELHDVHDDDILLHTDADEVPSRETLLFLKLHDNLPEPYCFSYHSTVFGFFWYNKQMNLHTGATFRMLKDVFRLQPLSIRHKSFLNEKKPFVDAYIHRVGTRRGPLMIGDESNPAGFHCSWCGTLKTIRRKLLSAINADFPRWGDYPMKCELSYIKSLIARGMWFTEDKCFRSRDKKHPYYAPSYMLQRPEVFGHLLQNPYKHMPCVYKDTAKNDYGFMMKNWHRMSKSQFLAAMGKNSTVPGNLLAVLKN